MSPEPERKPTAGASGTQGGALDTPGVASGTQGCASETHGDASETQGVAIGLCCCGLSGRIAG